MDCRITSISPGASSSTETRSCSTKRAGARRFRSGMTLLELLVSVSLGSFVVIGIAALTFYTGRSFAAMANYVDLDNQSRNALDVLTREIRQANRVIEMGATSVTLEDSDAGTLRYVWNPTAQTLTRYKTGETEAALLKQCVEFQFTYFQRNPRTGVYDYYPTAAADTCKLVQMRWTCRRSTLGTIINTESVQSAKVVIRKQNRLK